MPRAIITTMAKPKSSYVKVPMAPIETVERLQIVMEVLAGQRTVSDGARTLGLSRNHFQTLRNRCLEAMVEALTPKPPGRPAKNTELTALEEEVHSLEEENDRLRAQLQTHSRIIDNLSDMVRERTVAARTAGRGKRRRRSPKTGKTETTDDDRRARRHKAERMRRDGMKQRDAARAVSCAPSTLRRWNQRARAHRPLANRPGPGPKRPPSRRLRMRVESRIRESRGLLGAEALRRGVSGISRRDAATIKAATLTAMERERKERTGRVTVTMPGIIRAFDAMHTPSLPQRFLLATADAAVPFRTSLAPAVRYDGPTVAATLDLDFEQHGPPLVLRFDRARSHQSAPVDAVLAKHRVLPLHGPPHHPCFYGQLERQNSEHRAWMETFPGGLEGLDLDAMKRFLNERLLRRSLNWRTSAACWNERTIPLDDRDELRDEVTTHAQHLHHKGIRLDVAQRLAIEQALTKRNYLHIQTGGRC